MQNQSRFRCRFLLALALILLSSPLLCHAQISLPLPTAGERRVREALDQVIELHLEERPLAELVAELKQRYGLQIQLDLRALDESGLGPDLKVCLGGHGISLRSALRLALDQFDLAYIVRDGYLFVTIRTEAENYTEARVYPVGDLVTNTGEFTSAPAGDDTDPSAPSSYPRRVNYGPLIVLIQSIVRPDCWGNGNGPPRPDGYSPSQAITFPQIAEAHEEAEELLTALRAVRDRQQAAAARNLAQTQPEHDESGMTLKIYSLGGIPWNRVRRASIGASADAAISSVEHELKKLAAILPEFVDPASWQTAGGNGVIRAFQGSLLIQQTVSAHREIAKFLREIGSPWRVSTTILPPRLMPRPNWPCTPEPQPRSGTAEVEKALRRVVDFNFEGATLDDLLEWLRDTQAIEARLDHRALEDAGLRRDAKFSFHATDLELAEGLALLLGVHELTFAVRHEVLFITTKVEADGMLLTKVYPVYDLVAPSVETTAEGLLRAPDYRSLDEILRANVEPDSWNGSGGPGAMEEYAPCGALVISQTWQIHRRIERFLEALRGARKMATEKGEFQ